MLSPQLRREVDNLWKMFWSSGMTNPLTSIEQITYLLFLKRLEEFDRQRVETGKRSIFAVRPGICTLPHHPNEKAEVDPGGCAGHETCRWAYIRAGITYTNPADGKTINPHEHLSQYVFPWLRALDQILRETGSNVNANGSAEVAALVNAPLGDAYFQLPPEKTETLQRAIGMIDRLFRNVGTQSGNSDIMGDTFEYLLEEIQTSGKNGQFRTPRHIIRFLIELLDRVAPDQPLAGQTMVDPAAGTAGFLINGIQHLLVRATDPADLVYEWDGTPHRAVGGDLEIEKFRTNAYFTGFDNDRTMVRIGWMNLLLHGIEDPAIRLSDTLGKSFTLAGLYDVVLANPPFTGTIDTSDLNNERFSRLGVATNKSELLFVWLALDLLRVGGRGAIIVPDGVLFGSTGAHRDLRRRLLREHELLGVISLPAGVFQPYTGVKTSIIVFQKVMDTVAAGLGKADKNENATEPPRTSRVWFYEVGADGRSLDAKRTERPHENDLWDALEKWPTRDESRDYFQPQIFTARWREVDEKTVGLFPDQATNQGKTLGLDELWGLPQDPDHATATVIEVQQPRLTEMFLHEYLASGPKQKEEVSTALFGKHTVNLNRVFNQCRAEILDNDFDRFGRQALDLALTIAKEEARVRLSAGELQGGNDLTWQAEQHQAVENIVKEFAKLDGYNVRLKSAENARQVDRLVMPKSWSAPVRVWKRNPDWTSADETLSGSHDPTTGEVRPEYVEDARNYEKDGSIKTGLLDPICVEANDYNLSAGRYKPFAKTVEKEVDLAELISELQEKEEQIQAGLANLLILIGTAK
jgi:type I restriction enzyme M protein